MSCNHDWKPSFNQLGLFAWKCCKCQAIKESDPQKDQPFLLAYAQTLDQQFLEALTQWQSSPKPQKKQYRSKVHSLYWVTRISYLRAGIESDIVQSLDLSKQFPCPSELELIYSLLKPKELAKGALTQPISVFPNGNMEMSDTSLETVRKRRENGSGFGGIIEKWNIKGKKSYAEIWFRWEKDGKEKSCYVRKNKVAKVKKMNEKKCPVDDILEYIGAKVKNQDNKARDG